MEIKSVEEQKECDHENRQWEGQDVDADVTYENYRCMECGAHLTRVFTFSHTIVEVVDEAGNLEHHETVEASSE